MKNPEFDYKSFVEDNPVGMYQVDNTQEGNFIYCNDAFAKIFGYETKEKFLLEHKNFIELYVNPEDREKEYLKMKKNKEYFHETLILKNCHGKIIYPCDSCREIFDENSNKLGISGLLIEPWYSSLFDEINEGLYQISEDGKTIKKINKAGAKIFGYEVEDLINESLEIIYKDENELNNFIKAIKKNPEKNIENQPVHMKKKNGDEVIISINTKVILDKERKVIGREGTYRDITEDYGIRQILEEMPTPAYQVRVKENDINHDAKFTYCNKEFANLFGYEFSSKKNELLGKEVKILHKDKKEYDRFLKELEAKENKGTSLKDFRLNVKKKDETLFWVEIDSHVLIDHQNNMIARQGTLRDATEKIELEALRIIRDNIQRFSHRFLAPVKAINSNTEYFNDEFYNLIKNTIKKPEYNKYLDSLKGSNFKIYHEIIKLSENIIDNLKDILINLDKQKNKKTWLKIRNYIDIYIINTIEKKSHKIVEINFLIKDIENFLNKNLREDFKNNILKIHNNVIIFDHLFLLFFTHTIINSSKQANIDIDNLRSYINKSRTKEKFNDYEPVKYTYIDTDLIKCLKEVIDIYQMSAFDKGVEIRMISSYLNKIKLSKNHILIMLHNLIDNAVKYSYTRIGYIDIHIQESQYFYSIIIENYGVGILKEEIDDRKIFKFGERGLYSNDWNRTGSGVGLWESDNIAKNHKGEINITCVPAEKGIDIIKDNTPCITKVVVKLFKLLN